MQINLTTDYALRCLLYLAANPGSRSTAEIGEAIGVGRPYTHKVLRCMRDAGLVSSLYGKNGGYLLTAKPEQITVFDVMRVTEESVMISRSLEKDSLRPEDPLQAPVAAFYRRAQEQFEAYLRGVTLRDLLSGEFSLA